MTAALNGDDVAAVLEASGGVLFAVEPAIVWRPVRPTLRIDLCVSKCVFLVLFFLILFIACAVVWQSYVGRNILAQNSEFSDANVDDRGYVAVEWWIMSKTQAENPAMKEGTTRREPLRVRMRMCGVL